jgi:hypothetical protein
MEDRLIKLLEVATHPSTGEGERSNALSMFRKAVDAQGGVKAFVTGEREKATDLSIDTFVRMMTATKRAHRLEGERNAAITKLAKLRAMMRRSAGDDDLEDPVWALYGALDEEWRTLGSLVERARRHGFTGVEGTLRKRADNLAAAGKIEVRECGNGWGSRKDESRAWRIKQEI